MNKLRAWLLFTQERFNPLTHFTMLFLFVLFHYSFIYNDGRNNYFELLQMTIFCFIFYFKLRLYDEIKDYDTDLIINPHRPIPRGLLSIHDVALGIGACLILEHLILFNIKMVFHIYLFFIQIYSLLMFKEFFIGEFLRPHLTTYAVLHTFITFLITMFFLNVFGNNINLQKIEYLLIAVNNWVLFNIFEFGRKTFATTEEREKVDTYSSLFKPLGAISLQLSQIIINLGILYYLNQDNKHFQYALFIVLAIFMSLSFYYLKMNNQKSAKLYRMFSEIYIVLILIIMTTNNYL